ncbi:MAG: hypothetical protein HYV35_05515 [Lentisphaerae bacterium]|nr:hypothetical protein [Lentisphaerota bacterium]
MSTEKKINTLILSIYSELAKDFLGAFAAEQQAQVPVRDYLVNFEVVSGDPSQDKEFAEHLSRADALALVVRFLDVLSLEKIKNIYRAFPEQLAVPMGIFILRDKGEVDFKISCPSCGQKLWLRDTDIGKRGRCPNCTKPFVILSQADHLKAQLMLPDNIEVFQVTRGNLDSFQGALVKLFESVAAGITPADQGISRQALKNATVRIQVQDT